MNLKEKVQNDSLSISLSLTHPHTHIPPRTRTRYSVIPYETVYTSNTEGKKCPAIEKSTPDTVLFTQCCTMQLQKNKQTNEENL